MAFACVFVHVCKPVFGFDAVLRSICREQEPSHTSVCIFLQVHGKEIALGRPGDVVGEMALLGLSADGRRMRTAKCLTMCELVSISKSDLEDLMNNEGFRIPLRRMLSLFIDGLAGHVIKSSKSAGSEDVVDSGPTSTRGESDHPDGDWLEDFRFTYIPWQKIRRRLKQTEDRAHAHEPSNIPNMSVSAATKSSMKMFPQAANGAKLSRQVSRYAESPWAKTLSKFSRSMYIANSHVKILRCSILKSS